uniref:Uncharacterized protein n=1 Tax=Opuntia streptacantha TaxID=393608 RepID=A0A7C9AZS1_OPUST
MPSCCAPDFKKAPNFSASRSKLDTCSSNPLNLSVAAALTLSNSLWNFLFFTFNISTSFAPLFNNSSMILTFFSPSFSLLLISLTFSSSAIAISCLNRLNSFSTFPLLAINSPFS